MRTQSETLTREVRPSASCSGGIDDKIDDDCKLGTSKFYAGMRLKTKVVGCYTDNLKRYEGGLRMDKVSVKYFLHADNQVILTPSACEL
ncbi:hypothetical protein EVAR_95849_1 [Eumeta japonica]|uniref:Uncharacterized protein n=1 Tax=Eumeta variegata TaxID=151549 RepID=A0A4C1VM33_EUMVA|nr:hypothetical protein EVAR_95849_1 [Eumeta japonica]